ncbi:MAG: DNA repair protein RecO, partial [Candidatus Andersenbacteria bacterium]
AIVFSRKNIGEADRLVTFFSREDGLIRAIAKGVRKIPSARGGHLEPCTLVSVIISEGKTGNYAGNCETQDYFHDLHNDADAFTRACGHVRLFHKLFDTGQSSPELFDAFTNAWRIYPNLPIEKRIILDASIALQIIQHAGLLPDMRFWNAQTGRDNAMIVIKYIAEHPEHASRIALSHDDAQDVARKMNGILAQTLADAMVY